MGREFGRTSGRAVAIAAAALLVLITACTSDSDSVTSTTTATSSPATTTTTGPPVRSGVIPISDRDRERAEIALFGGGDPENSQDDEAVLVTVDGTELGRGPLAGWHTNRPDLGVAFDYRGDHAMLLAQAPVIDEPVPECPVVHGGGGFRAAVCGAEPETDVIRVFGADGSSRDLAGPAADVGHWRFALPSPKGDWVLAQWSGECEVPTAYLVGVKGGRLRPIDTSSTAIGWTRQGRAIVGLSTAACGEGAKEPGTYLLEPTSGSRQRIHPYSQGALLTKSWVNVGNRLEAVLVRAYRDLGLEICCSQPSHGGEDAETGFVFEGHDVGIYAAPVDDQPLPPEPGELRFTCGRDRYVLSDWGRTSETSSTSPPNRNLLQRAANRLVLGLYCTRGPTEP